MEVETVDRVRAAHRQRPNGCTYAPDDAERVRGWLPVDESDGTTVEVHGTALVDTDGVLLRFLAPTTLFEQPMAGFVALADRVNALAISPVADDISAWGLRALARNADAIARLHPHFGVAGLPDGTLRIEWTRDRHECSAEFDRAGMAYLHDYDTETGADEYREVPLADGGADVFARFVRGEGLA